MYPEKRINTFLQLAFTNPLLLVLLLCINFYGCTDNQPDANISFHQSSATISLKVESEVPDQVITRAVDESTIYDIHILVYNSSGELLVHQYSSGNSVTMKVFSGTDCAVFAIANTGNPSLFDGTVASTITKLKAFVNSDISTISGLITNNRLLMSGSLSGVNIQSGLLIPQIINGLTVKRMAAKISINITSPVGITITGYSIKKLPAKSYLIARPNTNEDVESDIAIGDDAATTYFNNSTANTWDSKSKLSADSIRKFSFYMYENRKGGRKMINGSTGTLTEQKEKAYYAPDNSSYVELYVTSTRFKYAIYKVFLGADNSQNYNVKRNWNYIYNVSILNEKEIEVTTESRVEKVALPSNCYMVPPNSQVVFPVSRANEDGITRITDIYNGWTASLLWTDNANGLSGSGAVKSVTAQVVNGTIKVLTGNAEGNALIIAKVGSTIVWSWHIWVTSYDPSVTNKTNNNKIFMDQNLGARNSTVNDVGSMGFFYQWGRKEPFPGNSNFAGTVPVKIYNASGTELTENGSSGTGVKLITTPTTIGNANNLEYSIQNPLSFLYRISGTYDWYSTSTIQNNYLWNTISGMKSVYDPSPIGWRVPTSGDGLLSPWYLLDLSNKTSFGYNWTLAGWYPAADYRKPDTGELNKNTDSYYWSATTSGTNAFAFFFAPRGKGQVSPSYSTNMYRTYGCSIRCVKE
jgi:hypothetical protein